jgi:hypothetical protein
MEDGAIKGLRLNCCIVTAIALLIVGETYGSTDTIGPNGINSAGLSLTSAGIAIGQVEVGRPGKRIADGGPDMPANANANIVPADVFRRDGAANTADVDSHAEEVAGVMISTDMTDGPDMDGDAPVGVATAAALYASASNVPVLHGQPEAAISAQHIALQNGGDVRAINFSFGEQLDGNDQLNGNSLLTQFVDWSAGIHDVLYVIAGNEDAGGIPLPTDNYNGLTIAYSTKLGGIFRQLDDGNFYGEDAIGPRTSVDLIAPGDNVEMASLGGTHVHASGTSFAAPHVTGTVALLQQYANQRIAMSDPQFDGVRSRRHEVMKAVLMNSADKLQDSGNGNRLGMSRTVLDQGGDDWLMSNAYTDDEIPLDIQIGAGHLNAGRAFTQFQPGERDSDGAAVPVVGWDYDSTDDEGDINKYALASPLAASQFVSITLAWDREVLFDNDAGTIGQYDIGDSFIEDLPFNDLDLYLMPAGATDLNDYVTNGPINARSISGQSTLEHIFFEIPATGSYEIWVHHFSSPFGFGQDYGLAWWVDDVPPAIVLQGDYSGDGIVGVEDYNIWKNAFGTTNAAADGNGNGIVDAADYTVWRDHLGQMVGSASIASVPEPRAFLSVLTGVAMIYLRCRKHTCSQSTSISIRI